MKFLKLLIPIICCFLVSIQINSQNEKKEKKVIKDYDFEKRYIWVNYNVLDANDNVIDNKTDYYYRKISNADTLQLAMESNYIFERVYKFSIKKETIAFREEKLQFNNAMLNVLLGEEVSSLISDSKDLSLQKSYAVISTADKSLFFGYTFQGKRDSKLKKLTNIFTVGLKAKLNEEFTTLLNQENGNLANEIGLNFKYTHVNRGTISFYKKNKKYINNLNEKVLVPKYVNKVIDAKKSKIYSKDLLENKNIYTIDAKADEKKQKQKEITKYPLKYFTKKYEELYLELVEEELKRLKSEKLYTFIRNVYWSVETFIPVSRTFYKVAPLVDANLTSSTIDDKAFYPWKINAEITCFKKHLKGNAFFLSGFVSAYNNNNIIAEELSTKTFNTFNSNNSNILDTTTLFYDKPFNSFVTGSIGVESVNYFIFKGALGLSFAIEQNFGNHYHPTNLKFGIPISLKDKEDKSTVNLELQFKKINNNDFLGIAVGYTFGKYVK